jgi:alpha-tubulin suppressor-like RCC1 family protein
MRLATLALAVLPGCSLLGLFDDPVVIEPCTTNEQCKTGPYANDECVVLRCDTTRAKCVATLTDRDEDGHGWDVCEGYPREFGTADDCLDELPRDNPLAPDVYAGAPELCDLVDNNCDGTTDEEPAASESCGGFACEQGVGCGGRDFVQIVAGCHHTCALRENGEVICWGLNDEGQVGIPADTEQPWVLPIKVPAVDDAVSIAAGRAHTCAVHETGEVTCWGSNDQARGGGGGLSGLTGDARVVAGYAHTCVVDEGQAQCWGWNEYGQLGDGTDGGQRPDARPVVALGDVRELTAGAGSDSEQGVHTCAIYGATRQASCWGWNGEGQLGQDPPGEGTPTPTDVPGQTDVVTIAAGPYMTCAAHPGGPVCWGWDGEEFDGFWIPPDTVQLIDGVLTPTKLSVGLFHACGVAPDGVYCWGNDENGQLGDDRAFPDNPYTGSLVAASNLVDVACGCYHSCAVVHVGTGDDSIVCWGLNDQGQLGDDSGRDSTRPVPIRMP